MMRSFRTLALSCLFYILAMAPGHLPVAAGELQRDIPSVKTVIDTSAAGFVKMEPSGLVPGQGNVLYMVSDNGKIVMLTLTDPVTAHTIYAETDEKQGDFESIAIVPGKSDRLYVGVEGSGKKNKPSIREFNLTTKKFTDQRWELKDVSPHMESMTFVPDDTAKKGFGGYFLAASSGNGKVYAYDLPATLKKTKSFGSAFSVDLPKSQKGMSDFYYFPAKSVLYVAYDDENPGATAGNQALWEYERAGTGKSATYGLIAQTRMPSPGLEAVTATTRSDTPFPTVHLYTGLDISSTQRKGDQKNRIDLYSGYLTYSICGGTSSVCSDIRGSHCGWCQSDNAGQPRARYGSSGGPVTGICQNWTWKYDDCR
jgi:hypothetical protein